MKNEKKSKKKHKIDIDSIFRKGRFTPPKVNFERATEIAILKGTARTEFTYEAIAKKLGLANSNNINKWYEKKGHSFETIKMMLWVTGVDIQDLIEPPKKYKR